MRSKLALGAAALAIALSVTVVWVIRARDEDAGAKTPVDIANEKLILHGEPTLPPDTDLSKPRVLTYRATITPDPRSTPVPTTSPRTCGPRDGPRSAAQVLAPYGEVRLDCDLIGTQWVMTTLGDRHAGVTGVIAIYQCEETDAQCLGGGEPAVAGEWLIFIPPNVAGVTVLAFHAPSILVINNLAQICFDLSSHTYDEDPGCAKLNGSP
jgi:hypothetical protein